MRIAVIGAGASGMMAAATLAELGVNGASVTLFDGNSAMGKKVAITGGGRCNATTGIRSKKELLSKYVRGADFLESALGKFSAKRAFEWFAQNGCPLKIEDDLRAFPVSDKGGDVVAVFERILAKAGTDLRLKTKVLSVLRADDGSFLVESEGRSWVAVVSAEVTVSGGGAAWGESTVPTKVPERRTETFDTVIVATG
jgi:predicted Rossmann fold flavoprotein